MEKFCHKYRIPSARLANWDYGKNGAYFVTICTAHLTHNFGEIAVNSISGKVETQNLASLLIATPLGQAAVKCWPEISVHFPFAIVEAFVVMPNHVHGIIVIDKPGDGDIGTAAGRVETQNLASLHSSPTESANRFGPQSTNLASIVRGYKIGVTKFARQNHIPFEWQERYHDHVIRNDDEYRRIWDYIQANPQKWAEDKFFNL